MNRMEETFMTKRKTDQPENITLKRMVSAARSQGNTGESPAARAVHRQPATRTEGTRAKRFADIERGAQA